MSGFKTIQEMFDFSAKAYSEKKAFFWKDEGTKEVITYGELHEIALKFAGAMLQHGIKKDDKIMREAENIIPEDVRYPTVQREDIPICCGANQGIMPPGMFVKNPKEFLNKVSQYKITVFGTMNFALKILSASITDVKEILNVN